MVRIHEFIDEGLGHSSYLIDLGDSASAIIDPPRFPATHESLAAQRRLRIAWTVDTHSHADDLPVYPTHGAGSFSSTPGTAERTSTLGRERATNPLLHALSEDEFVERLVAGFGTFPSYFARLPELNRRGPRRYDTLPTLDCLSADDCERQMAGGALLVDVRPFVRFGAGHVPGSLSNTLRPVFDGGPDTWATATGLALEVGS